MINLFWLSTIMIVYSYFGYPLVLLVLSVFPARTVRKGEITPSVSILVSVYNEQKVIEAKLRNCLALDYPKDKLEIVVGSDGSTDNTDTIVAKHARAGVKLIRLNKRTGKVNALNVAIPRLKGEIVVFSDANTIYERDAIKKLVRNFADPRIGCVCGELVFKNGEENEVGNLEGFYWRFEQFLKRREGGRGALLGANGGIYAIRKALFEPLPSNTIVEDFVMPMKILEKGYKVIYEPEAVAHEETSKRIVQEMERRVRIGAGDFQALTLTWRMLNPFRGFPAFAYISHKVIRWFVPFFLIFTFFANTFLLSQKFYLTVFLLQCTFYLMAIAGRALSKLKIRFKLFGLPYYFISMNIALFFGFIRFCANSQEVTWKRTER